ncbi:YqjD family protein [Methylotenera sp.]|uniref:DUF883 family protein n=1 Tax=Methylotenera sp. TaxID=2051956 RepID=UPI002730CA2C|nr:DUF883 family protein [Methylotenera sp.]MDP2230854.1 DUF883 family protein [Methylotenera sp.]MDP3141846.1 DUF883 family protein [Methylotenera sp.]
MSLKNLHAGTEFSDVTKEQLIADFKVVVADAEALIRATANQGGEAFATLRTRAEESLAVAKEKMAEAQDALIEKSKVAAKATDEYVHENPWTSVGVAAGVGLVIGLLIGRR